MSFQRLTITALLVVVPGLALTVVGQEVEPVDSSRLGAWVEGLSANDFEQREAAALALTDAGSAAIDVLIEELDSESLETCWRVRELLERLVVNESDPQYLRRAFEALSNVQGPLRSEMAQAGQNLALQWRQRRSAEATRRIQQLGGNVIQVGQAGNGFRVGGVILNRNLQQVAAPRVNLGFVQMDLIQPRGRVINVEVEEEAVPLPEPAAIKEAAVPNGAAVPMVVGPGDHERKQGAKPDDEPVDEAAVKPEAEVPRVGGRLGEGARVKELEKNGPGGNRDEAEAGLPKQGAAADLPLKGEPKKVSVPDGGKAIFGGRIVKLNFPTEPIDPMVLATLHRAPVSEPEVVSEPDVTEDLEEPTRLLLPEPELWLRRLQQMRAEVDDADRGVSGRGDIQAAQNMGKLPVFEAHELNLRNPRGAFWVEEDASDALEVWSHGSGDEQGEESATEPAWRYPGFDIIAPFQRRDSATLRQVVLDENWRGTSEDLELLSWVEGLAFLQMNRLSLDRDATEWLTRLAGLQQLSFNRCQVDFETLHRFMRESPEVRVVSTGSSRVGVYDGQPEGGGAGCWVGSVVPASPAATAELESGDRIVEIDGIPIDSFQELQLYVSLQRPETEVELLVKRGEGELRLFLTLERRD